MINTTWHYWGTALGRILLGTAFACGSPAIAQNAPANPAVGQQAAGKPALFGKVTDKAGKPIANATVQLAGRMVQEAKTDAQGNYVFSIRTAGQYQIGAEAQGFLSVEPWNSREPSIQLTPQSQVERNVTLERGASIVVTVTDTAGEPVKDARVEASPLGRDYQRDSARSSQTDDTGMAAVTVAFAKKQYLVSAVRDGFAPAHTSATIESIENPVDVALAMEPGETVKGLAICSDGKPAAGWEIYATPEWWASNYKGSMAKIDAKGSFTLKDLGPGAHKLTLIVRQADGGGTIHEIPVAINVPVAQQPIRVDLPMVSPASRTKASGTVRVTGGRPDYVQVQAAGGSGARSYHYAQVDFTPSGGARPGKDTVLEGRYTLNGIPAGTYEITFQSPSTDYKRLDLVKIPGEIPLVELKMISKPHLRGTVVDAATGKPITQFSIRTRKLQHLGDGLNYGQEPTWTQVGSPEGRFDLELASPGIYQAQVMVSGYAAIWSSEVRLENAETKPEIAIRLTPGGSLAGTIVDASGKPVAGATVIPYSVAGYPEPMQVEHFRNDIGATTTDAAGRFNLAHLAAGDEKLKVMHASFASKIVRNLNVTDGQSTDLGSIPLTAGGAVEGTIYDGKGKPAAGVPLVFRDQEVWRSSEEEAAARLGSVETDENGKFHVEHLPELTVFVGIPDAYNRRGMVRQIIRPIDGQTTHLDFGGSKPLTGRLIDQNGPIANRRIQLGGPSPYTSAVAIYAKTDSAGQFTVFGPPPGRYTIHHIMDANSSDWVAVKEVEITATATELGELKAEGGDVVIAVAADDPAVLQELQYVMLEAEGINAPIIRAMPDGDTPGRYRAKDVSAGKYQVTATLKLPYASYMIPVERSASSAETAVTLHLAKPSATLALSMARPANPSLDGVQTAILGNEDMTVGAYISSQGEQARTIKLPPGTYRVHEYASRKVLEETPAITLSEGESRSAEVSLAPGTFKSVMVCVWSPQRVLVSEAMPRILDANGKLIDPTRKRAPGTSYRLPLGHYRAVLDRSGADAVTKEFDVAAADGMINVGLFLPE